MNLAKILFQTQLNVKGDTKKEKKGISVSFDQLLESTLSQDKKKIISSEKKPVNFKSLLQHYDQLSKPIYSTYEPATKKELPKKDKHLPHLYFPSISKADISLKIRSSQPSSFSVIKEEKGYVQTKDHEKTKQFMIASSKSEDNFPSKNNYPPIAMTSHLTYHKTNKIKNKYVLMERERIEFKDKNSFPTRKEKVAKLLKNLPEPYVNNSNNTSQIKTATIPEQNKPHNLHKKEEIYHLTDNFITPFTSQNIPTTKNSSKNIQQITPDISEKKSYYNWHTDETFLLPAKKYPPLSTNTNERKNNPTQNKNEPTEKKAEFVDKKFTVNPPSETKIDTPPLSLHKEQKTPEPNKITLIHTFKERIQHTNNQIKKINNSLPSTEGDIKNEIMKSTEKKETPEISSPHNMKKKVKKGEHRMNHTPHQRLTEEKNSVKKDLADYTDVKLEEPQIFHFNIQQEKKVKYNEDNNNSYKRIDHRISTELFVNEKSSFSQAEDSSNENTQYYSSEHQGEIEPQENFTKNVALSIKIGDIAFKARYNGYRLDIMILTHNYPSELIKAMKTDISHIIEETGIQNYILRIKSKNKNYKISSDSLQLPIHKNSSLREIDVKV